MVLLLFEFCFDAYWEVVRTLWYTVGAIITSVIKKDPNRAMVGMCRGQYEAEVELQIFADLQYRSRRILPGSRDRSPRYQCGCWLPFRLHLSEPPPHLIRTSVAVEHSCSPTSAVRGEMRRRKYFLKTEQHDVHPLKVMTRIIPRINKKYKRTH